MAGTVGLPPRGGFIERKRLQFEQLESRLALAVVTVTTNQDANDAGTSMTIPQLISSPGLDGVISLREALVAANNTSGSHSVHFAIGSGAKTINLTSALPEITVPVAILGNTQPGFSGAPLIELNGTGAGSSADGLVFSSNTNTVRGLVINRFGGDGIRFDNSSFNTVHGSYVGTDITGTLDRGNNFGGILVIGGGGNTIGGTTAADRNVISGNQFEGIFIVQSSGNVVAGNYIGIGATGANDLGNGGDGIVIQEGAGNVVGGTTVASRNVISGNDFNGLVLSGDAATTNSIQGNFIGTNAAGTAAIGNTLAGVLISNFNGDSGATLNTIGGTVAGSGNVISGNVRNGIEIFGGAHHNKIQGNFIGTTADGLVDLGNGVTGGTPSTGFGIRIAAPNNAVGGDDDDDGVLDGVVRARNVISGNARGGVSVSGAGAGTVIAGNLIGLNALGVVAIENSGAGVELPGSTNVIVGGDTAGAGNTISGNTTGVKLSAGANNNQVWGNRIGTDASGSSSVANASHGVAVLDSPNNDIGGLTPLAGTKRGNVISGNGEKGVHIVGAASTNNRVKGNIIGLNSAGDAMLGNGSGGVLIENAPNNNIGGIFVSATLEHERNIISGNITSGIEISGIVATGNRLQGNWIGTSSGGNVALGNTSGITITGAPQNYVELDNVISGNSVSGVEIYGAAAVGNRIQGNKIGLDYAGSAALGNLGWGVLIEDASQTLIGGATSTAGTGLGNVISGNMDNGVVIYGTSASQNKVQGNLIGTAADGATPLGNRGVGVNIFLDASNNLIGGHNANEKNVIAFNGESLGLKGHGVLVESGTGNTIRLNSIYLNHGRGIDLNNDTITQNDFDDADTGANNLLNTPVVYSVENTGSDKKITFRLYSAPSPTPISYTWDFYAGNELDPSGSGEGRTHLKTEVQSAGTDRFSDVILTTAVGNKYISATVTDPEGNTSEFSMVDTDADGLADAWELLGMDMNEDGGVPDLTLPGADPEKKDLYVEIDAMQGFNPDTNALDDVVAAFANAPAASVDNPDGSPGVALHWIHGGDWDIDAAPWNDLDPGGTFPIALRDTKLQRFGLPSDRLSGNFDAIRAARMLTTRYCVFIGETGDVGLGGQGELPGNDFYICLGGDWRPQAMTRDDQAGTFMHELGHTLGLKHGGDESDLNKHRKPNYFSVMNYLWANPYQGFSSSWVLDYSRSPLPEVDEEHINELVGLFGTPGKVVPIGQIFNTVTFEISPIRLAPQAGPYDFDYDGALELSGKWDLNYYLIQDGLAPPNVFPPFDFTKLHGYDDWSNLAYAPSSLAHTYFLNGFDRELYLLFNSIGNGPGVFQFSRTKFDTAEHEGLATIEVVRGGGTTGAVSVQYQTFPGTASAGSDFTSVTGTLNFAEGEYIKTFTIPIVNDAAYEGIETVVLQLFNPVGAAIGPLPLVSLEITEPMRVEFAAGQTLDVEESAGYVEIELVLRGEAGQVLGEDTTVNVEDLLTGSAVAFEDYILPGLTSITFAAGSLAGTVQTVPLQVVDEFLNDPDLTIDMALRPIDSYAAVASPVGLTINILDDDGAVELVENITPGPAGTSFHSSYNVDGTLFFFVHVGGEQFELWTSSGTTADTTFVETVPATPDFEDMQPVVVGDLLFFAYLNADDDEAELWRSDGTATGTFKLRTFHESDPDPYLGAIWKMGAFDGELYFGADEGGLSGLELWRSNGEIDGTVKVAEINENELLITGESPQGTPIGSQPGLFKEFDGDLYFFATQAYPHPEYDYLPHIVERNLWKTTRTFGGGTVTTLAVDPIPGVNQYGESGPMAVIDGWLYFVYSTHTISGGDQIWRTDGTQSGTETVTQIAHPNGGFYGIPEILTTASEHVFFQIDTHLSPTTNGLWSTDGSADGTLYISDVVPLWITEHEGVAIFAEQRADHARVLRTDGTADGTWPIAFIPGGITPNEVAAVDGKVYFVANGELWVTDGTEVSTGQIADIIPGVDGSFPEELLGVGGNLFFTADDGEIGRELYMLRLQAVPLPSLVGDYNHDNVVNAADYTVWRNTLGTTGVPAYSGADGDGDTTIDRDDYDVWKAHYGESMPGAGSSAAALTVMEPEIEYSEATFSEPLETPPSKSQANTNIGFPLAMVEDRSAQHEMAFARRVQFNRVQTQGPTGVNLLLLLANARVQLASSKVLYLNDDFNEDQLDEDGDDNFIADDSLAMVFAKWRSAKVRDSS